MYARSCSYLWNFALGANQFIVGLVVTLEHVPEPFGSGGYLVRDEDGNDGGGTLSFGGKAAAL